MALIVSSNSFGHKPLGKTEIPKFPIGNFRTSHESRTGHKKTNDASFHVTNSVTHESQMTNTQEGVVPFEFSSVFITITDCDIRNFCSLINTLVDQDGVDQDELAVDGSGWSGIQINSRLVC